MSKTKNNEIRQYNIIEMKMSEFNNYKVNISNYL